MLSAKAQRRGWESSRSAQILGVYEIEIEVGISIATHDPRLLADVAAGQNHLIGVAIISGQVGGY